MNGYELRPADHLNLDGVEGVHTLRGALSHTSIGTFLACQQKFNWNKEHRLDPAVTATPLAVGRAFAEALQHGNPMFGDRVLREEAAAEAERAAGNPWITAPTREEVEIQAAIVRGASTLYLATYGTHGITREAAMRVRLRNPAIGGRLSNSHDLVCRVDAVNDDHTVMFEDKLVGQMLRGKKLAHIARLDRQVTIEAYTIWRTTGHLVNEIKYRMTLKPGIKQTKKETFDDYIERIGEDYATRPEHYLAEETVTRTLDDFLRLELELWAWAEQLRQARASGVYPRNVASCREFGGCAYLALCADEPGAINQFVERPHRSADEVAPAPADVPSLAPAPQFEREINPTEVSAA